MTLGVNRAGRDSPIRLVRPMKIRAVGLLGAAGPKLIASTATSAPQAYRATIGQLICCRQCQARAMFEAIWVMPCSAIAVASGIKDGRRPIRIMPPAIPNTPETNEVDSTDAVSAAAKGTLIMATSMKFDVPSMIV